MALGDCFALAPYLVYEWDVRDHKPFSATLRNKGFGLQAVEFTVTKEMQDDWAKDWPR